MLTKKDIFDHFKNQGYDIAGVKFFNNPQAKTNHGFLIFNDKQSLQKALLE
jgi:hypothetical protein